jgi:RNA polymerase sigma-70 factor (ECF subfamily)
MGTAPGIDAEDRRLVSLILRKGDERAFRQLYRQYTPRLLGFVTRLLAGTDSEAEDVVQETWIRACKGLHRFRWDSAFGTWLQGIGFNLVREQLRQWDRFRLVQTDDPLNAVSPDLPAEDRIDLERSIQMLPDNQRVVLVLHDIQGMKHREIAELLGIPIGTSKSHLSRSRHTLGRMLSGVMETEHEP